MRILAICHGGGPIGVGHVMRSLALAEAAVAAGHDVVVAGHFEGAFLQGQLAAAPVEVVELAARPDVGPGPFLDLVQRIRPDVLHVDSYELQGWLLVRMERSNTVPREMILSNVEDGPFGRRAADVVVDPTFGAELSPRPADGSTSAALLLRGSRYSPIRARVLDARRVVKPIDAIGHSVLVVMGGTDPLGLAPAAVGLLARTGLALDVTVIATGEIAERVQDEARGSSLSVTTLAPVDDLPGLMARQDLVVSAAGTSVWELCCIGVPMAVVWVVDNQRVGYERVVRAGAALGLGGPRLGRDVDAVGLLATALKDPQVRADLVRAGRDMVDGLGAWRVVRTWEQALALGSLPVVAESALVAHPATREDARALWAWRNDPVTRAGSRNPEPVPWPDHLAWVESTLTREDRLLLVVEDSAGSAGPVWPVGTVRWDLWGEGEWEVSITLVPERRGQSLGRALLRAGELALLEATRSSATRVTAYLAVVHVDNLASLRLFESSAYVPDLPPDDRGFMRFRKAAPVA
ncbi:MAG: GNAT family N-acetyltransferase [Dermatophilaceae bacterium]